MTKHKRSSCFVDDSDHELQRFRKNLKSRFNIGIGRTLDDVVADLVKQRYKKPDLFVLDLYFPEEPLNSEAELTKLSEPWTKYGRAHSEFLAVLA